MSSLEAFMYVRPAFVVFCLLFSLASFPGDVNAQAMPQSWSSVPGFATGTTSPGLTRAAANMSSFTGGFTAPATLNVAGKMISVPVGARVAANAAKYIRPFAWANPALMLGVTAASLYAQYNSSGFEVEPTENKWYKVTTGTFTGTVYYGVNTDNGQTFAPSNSVDGAGNNVCAYYPNCVGYSITGMSVQINLINNGVVSPFFRAIWSKTDTITTSTRVPATETDLDTVVFPAPDTIQWPEVIPAINPQELPFSLPVENPVINPGPNGAPLPIPGPESVTTNPDGSTLTEKTEYLPKSDGTNYWFDNRVTNNNFNPVTNTTTTTVKDTVNPDTPQTDCDKFPDSFGCAKIGDVPPSDPVNRQSHVLDVTPRDFGGSASCPPDVTFTAFGQTYAIPYTPVCDVMGYIKPIILLAAAALAAYILADSFKV